MIQQPHRLPGRQQSRPDNPRIEARFAGVFFLRDAFEFAACERFFDGLARPCVGGNLYDHFVAQRETASGLKRFPLQAHDRDILAG
jgi:hypothetical protein